MEAIKIKTQHLGEISSFGSITSAFLSSLCCIGPIVFALLGVGSAGFVIGLEKYRLFFIIIAIVSWGTAFYYTYRKKGTTCETDSVCSTSKEGKYNKTILWLSAIWVGFFIIFPYIFVWALG